MDTGGAVGTGAGWRSSLVALAMWSPLVVALTIAGWVIAPAAADRLPSGGRTEAVIGLTPESEWPFHDSWMALAAGTLDDGTIVADAQRELGIEPADSRVETEPNNSGSRSTLTVTVTASSDADAVALANEVVTAMVAAAPEAPIEVLNRADLPTPPPRRSTALAGAFVGLLGGASLVPWLDRRFGPVRSPGHPEFRGRIARWIDPMSPTRLLPVSSPEQELAAALRSVAGPVAVLALGDHRLATDVAKALAAELSTEVLDAGAVTDPRASEVLDAAVSVVLVARRRELRRHLLHRVIARLEALGVDSPSVAVLP